MKDQNEQKKTPPPQQSTYLVDQDDPRELARLLEQDKYMVKVTGLYPAGLSQERIQHMRRVIDIGCGPGHWDLQMAAKFPHLQVLGIDISQQMIEYARGSAESRELANVSFERRNALEPLPFADNTFDVVCVRYAAAWIPNVLYPAFLQECKRIVKPAGYYIETEGDNGLTSSQSPALAKSLHWLSLALSLKGLAFGDGRYITITPNVVRMVKEAGFQMLPLEAHVADSSGGDPSRVSQLQSLTILMQLIVPLLTKLGISRQEFDETAEALKLELEDPYLTSFSYLLTIWGQKEPVERERE